MKIIIENKQAKLERIINEEIVKMHDEFTISNKQTSMLNESWLTQQIKKVPDLFGLVSGTRGLEYAEKTGSEDAWKLFRAMVGPGTDEDTIEKVFAARTSDIPKLAIEFDELIALARSIKSLKLDDIKFAIAGPLAGDQDDTGNWLGDAGLIMSGLLLTTSAAAMAPWVAVFSQLLRVMNTHGAPVRNWGGRSAKRGRERLKQGTTGGIFTPFLKMYTKLVNAIPDKSLEAYLRDDGMNREADMVRDAIAGGTSGASADIAAN